MAAITTRETSGGSATVKGSPLTNAELDTNFINLNLGLTSAAAITGGTINNTSIGATTATTGRFTTLALTATTNVLSDLTFTDNTYDIGKSGATRPRNLYLAADAVIGGDLAVNGATSADITTTTTTATVFNATATTVNIASAATTIGMGAATGTTTINNNLTVAGNITFGGGGSSLSATTIQIDDTLISLADNNTADILDIGFYAGYQPASTALHTGFVRDATDSVWKLFSGVSAQPTTTVDFTSATYDAMRMGALTATGLTVNGANVNTSISPTGTGTVAISPAGALTINPTTASTINNTSIGATTASTGRFTTLTLTAGTNVLSDLTFTDATYDIGKSGATRPRNLFLSGTATANTITSAAATNLTLQSAGTPAITIDTSQNVGIGTTSPYALLNPNTSTRNTTATWITAPLFNNGGTTVDSYVELKMGNSYVGLNTIGQSSIRSYANVWADSASALTFSTSTTGGTLTERMRIDSSGNVGIGTAAPTTKLTINNNTVLPSAGAIAGTNLWQVGADASDNNILLDQFGSGTPIFIGRKSTGTSASPSAIGSGSTIVGFAGRGYGATGYSSGSRASMTFVTEEAWTDTAQGTNIRFSTTANGTTTNTERMRIDSSGNVIVGTTSSFQSLVTSASNNATGVNNYDAANLNTGSNTTKFARYSFSGVDTVGTRKSTAYIDCGPAESDYVGSYLAFSTRVSDAVAERMRINSSGRLLVSGSSTALTAIPGSVGNTSVYSRIGMTVVNDTTTLGYFQTYNSNAATDLKTWRHGGQTDGSYIFQTVNDAYSSFTTKASISTTGVISDIKGDVRAAPIQTKASAYVLVATDAGQTIYISTGGVTINASVFNAGDMVTIINNSASNQTITAGASVTFRLAGTATTGNRTLAQRGMATFVCVVGGATPDFYCSGAGLT